MRIDISLPKRWEDLSPKQVLYVVKLLTEQLPFAEFLSACFLHFSGWKVVKTNSKNSFTFKNNKSKFIVCVDLFHTLCNELLWLQTDVGRCVNPAKIGKALGCDSDLYDVTLEQYLFADSHYKAYNYTSNKKHLAILTASLYLKKKQKFDDDAIDKKRYKYFLKYPIHLQAVLLWYTGTKLMLKEKFPELFANEDDAPVEYSDPEKIYLNTLSALNAGRIIDNPKVLQTPCIEALHELNQLNKRAIKMNTK